MTDTVRKHIAMRDKNGQPIPGIPDGIYDVKMGERVEDGDTVSYPMTLTPVNPLVDKWSAYQWMEDNL